MNSGEPGHQLQHHYIQLLCVAIAALFDIEPICLLCDLT